MSTKHPIYKIPQNPKLNVDRITRDIKVRVSPSRLTGSQKCQRQQELGGPRENGNKNRREAAGGIQRQKANKVVLPEEKAVPPRDFHSQSRIFLGTLVRVGK